MLLRSTQYGRHQKVFVFVIISALFTQVANSLLRTIYTTLRKNWLSLVKLWLIINIRVTSLYTIEQRLLVKIIYDNGLLRPLYTTLTKCWWSLANLCLVNKIILNKKHQSNVPLQYGTTITRTQATEGLDLRQ